MLLPVTEDERMDLARLVADASMDGKICIRVSTADTPVQVTYRAADGREVAAYGSTLPEALVAAAIRQDSEISQAGPAMSGMDKLPGHLLGPHDSIVLRGRDTEPLEARLVWVHRAAHTVNGKARGERCEEDGINAHAVLVDDLDGLSLSPAVTCSTCGRTGWITEGKFIPVACQTDYSDHRDDEERRDGTDRRKDPA